VELYSFFSRLFGYVDGLSGFSSWNKKEADISL